MSKLTPKFVREVATLGSYQDGRGLFLRVTHSGRKNWVFRYSLGGRHDLTLGVYPVLSLRDARLEADKQRLDIARGIDPLATRASAKAKTDKSALHSFKAEAERYIKTHSPAWSSKHQQQWRNSMATYAYPALGKLPVSAIDTAEVLKVLEPVWGQHPVTANRLRNRIELVLDAAKAHQRREGENPARWRGHLDKLLPKPGHTVQPFTALTSAAAGKLLYKLDSLEGAAARACELMILTATRNQEVRGARWEEIDRKENLWVIPAERMKSGKPHRIPLTESMLKVLKQQQGRHPEWVFINARRTGPIPSNAIGRTLALLKITEAVPHGFRSTFRTWAAEYTDHQREVCEMALAHSLGSKVEAAYNRGDLLEKRRALMQDWEDFLLSNFPQLDGERDHLVPADSPSASPPLLAIANIQ